MRQRARSRCDRVEPCLRFGVAGPATRLVALKRHRERLSPEVQGDLRIGRSPGKEHQQRLRVATVKLLDLGDGVV